MPIEPVPPRDPSLRTPPPPPVAQAVEVAASPAAVSPLAVPPAVAVERGRPIERAAADSLLQSADRSVRTSTNSSFQRLLEQQAELDYARSEHSARLALTVERVQIERNQALAQEAARPKTVVIFGSMSLDVIA